MSLRCALVTLLVLGACDDPAPQVDGADAGEPCQTSADCGAGLFCIGLICQDPTSDPEPIPPEPEPEGLDPEAQDPEPNNNDPLCGDGACEEAERGDCPEDCADPDSPCQNGADLDDDGLDDGDEGDGDPDGDGLPNCTDRDSDDDGLLDAEEDAIGSNPQDQDSDRDAASDLLEFAAGTALTDPGRRPDDKTLLAVVHPDQGAATRRFTFSSRVRRGDIYFLMDTSTTMSGEIDNLKQTIISSIIPRIRDTLPDVHFGVGHFDDFALDPDGLDPAFRPFENLQDVTADDADVVAAINRLQTCCVPGDGQTIPESQTVALWALATEDGLPGWIPPRGVCQNKGKGYPCFRADALPIVVLITDADFHNGPSNANPYFGVSPAPPSFNEAIDALNRVGAKVVGIFSGATNLRSHIDAAARQTGAVNDANAPLVFTVNGQGSGLDLNIISAFEELTGDVRRDVSVEAEDPDPLDAFDPTSLMTRATPISAAPPNGILATDARRFLGVIPGTALTFEVEFSRGPFEAEPEGGQHRIIHINLRVLGDGSVLLDDRSVYLVIARQGSTIQLLDP